MKFNKKDKKLYIIPNCNLIASKVETLRDAILDRLKNENSLEHIIFDVKDIEVVDSLGVNLIIGTYRQSGSQSMSFEIINANEKFIKISNFFKFQDYFNVSPEKKSE